MDRFISLEMADAADSMPRCSSLKTLDIEVLRTRAMSRCGMFTTRFMTRADVEFMCLESPIHPILAIAIGGEESIISMSMPHRVDGPDSPSICRIKLVGRL